MALGLLSATFKSAVAIKENFALASSDCEHYIFGLFLSWPPVLALGMVLWSVAKIYFAFQCESHMWNLTSGCVHH